MEDLGIYKFVEDFTYGDFHNESVKPTDKTITLVLDGQQRLTSLLIGLRGSYKSKEKNKRWDNPNSWIRQTLYLNLMQDPGAADDSLTEVTYGLSFFQNAPPTDNNSYWFPVSRILQFGDQNEFNNYLDNLLENLEADGISRTDRKLIERNIENLYRAIWKDECIAYFTETSKSIERVLDIFVRANEGGTKLSKSDLLLSTITTTWGDLNARDEIYQFVDYLNTGLARPNDFDKDWVMKACLVLSDLPNAYKVSNFSKSNLELIRSNWEKIKSSLETTARIANDYGIDRDTLTSTNALLPIAYFVFKNSLRFNSTDSWTVESVNAIHRWLVKSLLASTFGGSSDSTIAISRKIISESNPTKGTFPERALLAGLRKQSQIDFLDSRSVDDLLSIKYTDKRSFLALSLLFKDKRWGSAPYHIDHIFPQSRFSKAKLLSSGVSEWGIEEFSARKDRLANLQLLPSSDNIEKSNQPFDVWISSRTYEFVGQHFIPADRTLYQMDSFIDFIRQRETLLRNQYAKVLGFDEASIVEEPFALLEDAPEKK